MDRLVVRRRSESMCNYCFWLKAVKLEASRSYLYQFDHPPYVVGGQALVRFCYILLYYCTRTFIGRDLMISTHINISVTSSMVILLRLFPSSTRPT
ncbi:hypothetical protein ACN38_g2272 [Penicillium nordicum]|uniref:Uncharacterized protein n=1 Tax=Penicillium nordicum TaxID=229535 RepID=A0A0M8PAB3_9EURO|nr:hypothetical protein ACN38_g2272 [Penicillium nordicum]